VLVLRNITSFSHEYKAAIICCGLPLLLTFLPFTTDKVGVYYDGEDTGYCGIVHKSTSPLWTSQLWNFLFDVVVISSLLVTCTFLIRIRRVSRSDENSFISAYVKMAVRKLIYYPVIILLCWTLQIYLDVVYVFYEDREELHPGALKVTSDLLVLLQGLFTALVFWFENEEIRLMWGLWFNEYIFCLKVSTGELDRIRVLREEWEDSERTRSTLVRFDTRDSSVSKGDGNLRSKLLLSADNVTLTST